jgi:alkanesulfonate monooxygenase SsuD/methylene tetrahydromethanopterin reductase-like flavin-dependent oxidoreductase (luciferase family)
MVGGNGPKVTWRLAARYADELNLDGMTPDEITAALPTIRARCQEIERDPASLTVSNNVWWGHLDISREARVELFGRYRETGIRRVQALIRESADSDEALEAFAEDCRAAGADLA